MSCRISKSGFTLVELLVVIAIIGLLVALLLPAVSAARKSARRMQCANNMKQLGLACHMYEEANGHLPAGAYWYTAEGGGGDDQQYGNCLIRLLPFIEEQAIYDLFDFSRPTNDTLLPDGSLVGSKTIPMFICPSDNNQELYDGVRVANYSSCQGPSGFYANPDLPCEFTDEWNDARLSEDWSPTNHRFFAGVFHRNEGVEIKFKEIKDGLTKTIFFGEVRRECSRTLQNGWAKTINGQGLASTLVPINFDSCDYEATDGCHHPNNWTSENGFKSLHGSGANALFGDSAVRFLSESIDYQLFQYLGAKADGQVVELP